MSMPDMRQEAVGKAAIILRAARGAFLANGFCLPNAWAAAPI